MGRDGVTDIRRNPLPSRGIIVNCGYYYCMLLMGSSQIVFGGWLRWDEQKNRRGIHVMRMRASNHGGQWDTPLVAIT